FLRADKEVAYGLVVRVMGDVKAAGIDRLGIVAEPEKEQGK
ncbi:biopolymer transporter ExbD, partial [Pseudodesulfovibrio sp.]